MTKLNKKPLIIWDFDGVMADSEKLWVGVWRDTLKKEKNIVLTRDQEIELLAGMADRTKKHHIQKAFPNETFDAEFMRKIEEGETYAGNHFLRPIMGVEKILQDKHFDHCIATGSTKAHLVWKMDLLKWTNKYMNSNDYFTVDMVEHGKPAPDIFLLAAKTKGHDPKDCVVIEDSIHGMNAAKAAGIKCIAFIGAEGNDTPEYRRKCSETGVIAVCATMEKVHKTLQKLFIDSMN
ncbi:MAG: HAD family phosphatase [Alphaproteobacteria bacterium]|nr:HAD family phosphatase [Alphaproteobacteria bacterium]